MSWKNLKQQSLADALLVEHDAVTELDDAHDHLTRAPAVPLKLFY